MQTLAKPYYLYKYSRYGNDVNNCDTLKFVALVLMIIDHIGLYLLPENEFLRAVGRASAPIWLFFIGYFYHHKDGPLLYTIAALDFMISVILGQNNGELGILFTIIISRVLMRQIDNSRIDAFILFIMITIFLLLGPVSALLFSYGTVVMLFSLAGMLQCKKHKYTSIVLMIATLCYFLMQQSYFQFSEPEVYLFALVLLLTVCNLHSFKMETTYSLTHHLNGSALGFIVRICARNSLLVYFVHLGLLRLC